MKNKTKVLAFTMLAIIILALIGMIFGSCSASYKCPTYSKHRSPIGSFNAKK